MDRGTGKLLLTVGVFAGGAYVLYKLWQTISASINKAIDPATSALASWYVQLTGSGQEIPSGMIMMPNAQTVPVAAIPGGVQSVAGTNSASFTYGGTQYYLNSPHDANGNWAASTTLASVSPSDQTLSSF